MFRLVVGRKAEFLMFAEAWKHECEHLEWLNHANSIVGISVSTTEGGGWTDRAAVNTDHIQCTEMER